MFADKTTFVGVFLSKPLVRGIGLISYSAYLWHQPLLAFLRIRFGESPPLLYLVVAVTAVLPLSTFSYFYIEQPFRQKSQIDRKRIFASSAFFTVLTLILALFLIRTANNQLTLNETEDSYMFDLKHYGSMNYTSFAYLQNERRRTFLNDTSMTGKKLILIGDSYSQDFYNIITEGNYLKDYDVLTHFVHFECQIYIGPEDRQQFILPKRKQMCRNAHDIKHALPLIRQADIVILAASWKEWSARRLPMTIKRLNLTNQQRLIIIGAKHFGKKNLRLYMNKTKEFRVAQHNRPYQWFIEVNRLLEETIDPSIFVNVMRLLCTGQNNTCPLFTPEGRLISYDGYHVTKYGALYIGELIFKEKPLNEL